MTYKKIPIKRRIKFRLDELKTYFKNIIKAKNKEQLKVVIFAQGRTGSTLLESLLESTGYFQKNGELLTSKIIEVLFPYQFINGKAKAYGRKNFIFHLKIYHLTNDRKRPVNPDNFIKKFDSDGWKIIYLHRDNKVRHVLSNLVADQRGGFHKHDSKKENVKLKINLEEFERMLKNRIKYSEQEQSILKNKLYVDVAYERDLQVSENHENTIRKILDFLELNHNQLKVETSHRKVNTKKLSDLISNYEEFVDCLKENDWYHFIEDEK